jgi:hypothetical protein
MKQLKTLSEIRAFFDGARNGQKANFRGISGRDFQLDRGVLDALTEAEIVDEWGRYVPTFANIVDGVPDPFYIFQGEGSNGYNISNYPEGLIRSQSPAIIGRANTPNFEQFLRESFKQAREYVPNTESMECIGIPHADYRPSKDIQVVTMMIEDAGKKVTSWLPFRRERTINIASQEYNLDGSSASGIKQKGGVIY